MPNYVMNDVVFNGSSTRLAELRAAVKSTESEFDFKNLIPVPQELMLTAGGEQTLAVKCAKGKRFGKGNDQILAELPVWAIEKASIEEWVALGERYLRNEDHYGSQTWFEYCINSWGTKWNACDVEWKSNDHVRFQTAWSMPRPVYEKLHELFPDIQFSVDYADEDIGTNCGTLEYDGEDIPCETEGDEEFACSVWDYDYDDFLREREEIYAQ